MFPDEMAYHPDIKDGDAATGLYCFLSSDRACGAECMAFSTEAPEGQEYIGQWAHCRLLTGLHKGAKHLTILAQVGGTLVKQNTDLRRQQQPVPPSPRGPTP